MIETLHIKSDALNNERELFVMLPPGYHDEPSVSYPVLFMQDGQNIFSTHGNWFKKWNVDLVLEGLYREETVEKIIVVGITHLNRREYEFTPTIDTLMCDGGGAYHYIHFMKEELRPFIEKSFRVKADREHYAVCGSSLGGLITLVTAIHANDVFSRFAAVSPSLWWDFGVMLERVRSWNPRLAGMKLWIDIGMKEGPGSVSIDEILKEIYNPTNFCRVLCNILLAKGFILKKNLMYVEDPEGIHDEITWGNRFSDIMKFFYPAKEDRKRNSAGKK